MTTRRAADQGDIDVTEAHHDIVFAGIASRPGRRRGSVAQPAASRLLAAQPESVWDARDFTQATLGR